MNLEAFKQMSPYEQELITLLTRIAKALEGIEREAEE